MVAISVLFRINDEEVEDVDVLFEELKMMAMLVMRRRWWWL